MKFRVPVCGRSPVPGRWAVLILGRGRRCLGLILTPDLGLGGGVGLILAYHHCLDRGLGIPVRLYER